MSKIAEVRPALPRALMVMLGMAATVVVILGLQAASDIIAPAFLALVLTIVVHPMRNWLVRWMPGWASTLVCVVVVYLLVLGLVISLLVSAARFATLLPSYQAQFEGLIQGAADGLTSAGVSDEQIQRVADSFDLGRLVGVIESLLSSLAGVTGDVVFVLTLVIFMAMDGRLFPRLLGAAGEERPDMVSALRSFSQGTRSYLLVSTVFGLIVAVFDTVALEILGIPAPILWGLLAFITNYIPNIGFVIGVVPPAILGLLEGGPGLMLWVIVVYSVINVIIQSVIQPKFVGDAVGLSVSLTFLSLIFWTWVIGPLGALLAIPLTLLAKAVFIDADPRSQWLRPLVSGVPAPAVDAQASENAAEDAQETAKSEQSEA
ncbi:MAG: AI-2E family transporter [Ornithinimicrobium sp.]